MPATSRASRDGRVGHQRERAYVPPSHDARATPVMYGSVRVKDIVAILTSDGGKPRSTCRHRQWTRISGWAVYPQATWRLTYLEGAIHM
jgi:hypothetical protein